MSVLTEHPGLKNLLVRRLRLGESRALFARVFVCHRRQEVEVDYFDEEMTMNFNIANVHKKAKRVRVKRAVGSGVSPRKES